MTVGGIEKTFEGFVEFTSNRGIAEHFASLQRVGYVLTVEIAKKYLTRAESANREDGWIVRKGAPIKVIHVTQSPPKRPAVSASPVQPMDNDQLRTAMLSESRARLFIAAKEKADRGETLTADERQLLIWGRQQQKALRTTLNAMSQGSGNA